MKICINNTGMASSRLVSSFARRSLSPRSTNDCRTTSNNSSSRRTPERKQSSSIYSRPLPFSIDTPNRKRIINDSLALENKFILGIGSFGIVYKALYKGTQVAVKLIKRREHDTEIEAVKQAITLRHPNIVQFFGIEKGSVWSAITMELCATSLQNKLEETKLSKNERLEIWRDIAVALNFCHNSGIIHADVKPKNVLITCSGGIKLADFGSAIIIGDENKAIKENYIPGTPGYVAPEVIKGCKPSIVSDIYSLGILAWQLLSREVPYAGYHPHTILYQTAKGVRPYINHKTNVDDECDGRYKILYEKMWSELAESRPTLNIIIKQLKNLLGNY